MSLLAKIVDGKNLSFEEAYELFNELKGSDGVLIGAYLAALQTKGYTGEELAGLARAMRDSAVKLDLGKVADTAGTGRRQLDHKRQHGLGFDTLGLHEGR